MAGEAGQQKVQLGCGTLILIAVIVLIFSGRSDVRELSEEVHGLRQEVVALRQEVAGLKAAVERLSPPPVSERAAEAQ